MFYKLLLIILLLTTQPSFAEFPFYFLCGSDEDGCQPGREEFCACIPVSKQSDQPYCLDLDAMTCNPLSTQPHCDLVINGQAKCLATLFQSEPNPPCKIVTQSFCQSHSVYLCDEAGHIMGFRLLN